MDREPGEIGEPESIRGNKSGIFAWLGWLAVYPVWETRLQGVRLPATTGTGKRGKGCGGRAKKPSGGEGQFVAFPCAGQFTGRIKRWPARNRRLSGSRRRKRTKLWVDPYFYFRQVFQSGRIAWFIVQGAGKTVAPHWARNWSPFSLCRRPPRWASFANSTRRGNPRTAPCRFFPVRFERRG